MVLGLSFGGWDSSEAVHEALLVVPGYVVGGDVFDIGQRVQRASAKRRIGPDALVLVEPDRGLGQGIVVGVANAADRRPETRKAQCFAESHAGVLGSGIRVVDGVLDRMALARPQRCGLTDRRF